MPTLIYGEPPGKMLMAKEYIKDTGTCPEAGRSQDMQRTHPTCHQRSLDIAILQYCNIEISKYYLLRLAIELDGKFMTPEPMCHMKRQIKKYFLCFAVFARVLASMLQRSLHS